MGYASLDQKGTGLLQRIYSRAFIVASSSKPSDRVVYIIADIAAGDTAIRAGLLDELNKLYPGVYSQSNVALVGTHSHSGPGAFFNYLLPQITTLGLDKQSYGAIVQGLVLSVKRAHESLKPGYLTLGKGTVEDAGINRSPWAYDQNPAEEKARYADNVDRDMTLLGFETEDGKKLGVLNWYPTHGTSMYNNNTLVSGDNKGYAAVLFEKEIGNGFVAGFSQANVGDVSPNTLGPVCEDTGLPCNYKDSTCNGKTQMCKGRGPGFRISDKESCAIIGKRQFDAAKRIWGDLDANGTPVTGEIRSFHTFVDHGQEGGFKFRMPDGSQKNTCKAAMGFSFAGGTTDGPGAFDFTQGDSGSPNNPFWLLVRNLLKTPSKEQVECQKPKPILLAVGEMDKPYAWSPNIVDIQMFRIGQLAVIVAPGEASTMAGRRWMESVAANLDERGIVPKEKSWVVLGGPANTYSHYITTPEEYSVQRYEGASTLYGQWTLYAYINVTSDAIPYLADSAPSRTLPPGPPPPVHTDNSLNLNTGVVQDSPPPFKSFGDVLTKPSATYSVGDTVKVKFVGANPRNNLRLEGTFLAVERKSGSSWSRIKDDSDWELVYEWKRTEPLTGQSEVTASWTVGQDSGKGTYRIRYYGDAKRLLTGKVVAFEGVSPEFSVV